MKGNKNNLLTCLLAGVLSVSCFWAGDAGGPAFWRSVPPSHETVPTLSSNGRSESQTVVDPISEESPSRARMLPTLDRETSSFSDLAQIAKLPDKRDGGAWYRMAEGVLNDVPQRVHVLTVDPASFDVNVKPVLSFNRMFGYEKLSVMAKRAGALAAVNGGFGPSDGRAAGAVMLEGVFLHPADAVFPVLLLGEESAALSVLRSRILLSINGTESPADVLNPYPMPEGVAVFTPAFGTTHRLEESHLVVVIRGKQVTDIRMDNAPVAIPEDGFLLVAKGKGIIQNLHGKLSLRDEVSWHVRTLPVLSEDVRHALACGSYLVRDGLNVAPYSDPWAGVLDSPAPRTAVGVGEEGQLVFVVAEGRIPSVAAGFSGNALAELLIEMGVREAALLDGGASTELLIGGEVMNNLSAGRERAIPSAFVLLPK